MFLSFHITPDILKLLFWSNQILCYHTNRVFSRGKSSFGGDSQLAADCPDFVSFIASISVIIRPSFAESIIPLR